MHQELQTSKTNLFTNLMYLKKTIQLLVSVSIIFFSYSSWLSIIPFHLPNHNTIDRNYMFLLCNGILVFLSLISSSPFGSSNDLRTDVSNTNGFYSSSYVVEKDIYNVQSLGHMENVVVEEEDNGYSIITGEDFINEELNRKCEDYIRRVKRDIGIRDQQSDTYLETVVEEEEEEEEEEEGRNELMMINGVEEQNGDEEQVVVEEEEMTEKYDDFIDEELNKKFDDFIRKMRGEIGFGAQQQLIMV